MPAFWQAPGPRNHPRELRLRGQLGALRDDNPETVESDLRAGIAELDAYGAVGYRARAQEELGRWLISRGRGTEATSLLEAARATYEEIGAAADRERDESVPKGIAASVLATTCPPRSPQPEKTVNPATTALILVGYQNDYFAKDGILRGVVEDPNGVDRVLQHTLAFVRALAQTDATIISTPIILADDYRAMASPVGILNTMKEVGAFKEGSIGAENIPELDEFGDHVLYVGGKVGFNAFSNTTLGQVLNERGIENVLVCGMVTSLCIDSTGRAAYERGYDVTIVSDCTSARTDTEHQFFCENVFPLYGRAATSTELLDELASTSV